MGKKLKLYLAGPISGWREQTFNRLKGHFDIYDPIKHSRQRSQSEYAPDDLKAVKNCDVILAYQPKDKPNNLAMAVEATLGYCHKAVVIYVDETGAPDPILIAISKRPFSELGKAIEFLKKFSFTPIALDTGQVRTRLKKL
jgi:hypothetical protein